MIVFKVKKRDGYPYDLRRLETNQYSFHTHSAFDSENINTTNYTLLKETCIFSTA